MSHPSEPQLQRMPLAAFLAVVLLVVRAGWSSLAGFELLRSNLLTSAILLVTAVFTVIIAGGIARRRRWARVTGFEMSFLMLGVVVVVTLVSRGPFTTAVVISVCMWIVTLIVLSARSTKLWCNETVPERPARPVIDMAAAQRKPFSLYDEVRLVEDVDRDGLRAGMSGIIVGARADSRVFEVEFYRSADEAEIRVDLRPEQIRPVRTGA